VGPTQLEPKIWWDSQLLLCSPIPQSRRAPGLYCLIKSPEFYTHQKCTAVPLHLLFRVPLLLDKPIHSFYDHLPIAFYNLFIGYPSIRVIWHRLVNHLDLDILPMIHIYAIFVAEAFLLRKNMRRIGCSIRISHQLFVMRTWSLYQE
jgi:hypothetical protein